MKMSARFLPGLLWACLLAGGIGTSSAQDVHGAGRPGVSAMLESVTPAVVNIKVTGHETLQQNQLLNDPFFRRFFDVPDDAQPQPQTQETQSVGSGVIIDADKGYVLTNNHVVENADAIEVTLQDKRTVPAKLIGTDKGTDIALLQVEADNLTAIPLSDSDTLRVGDFVVAIGNPFGIGQTVTTGIVSALDRTGIGDGEGYEDFIQTDASINPGNSGGALVDYDGKLVGINSAIISPSGGGNVGIGFAVPINMAKSVVDQLVEFGEVRRGMLGVLITDLTPDVVEALALDVKEGAVVSSVTPDSPAAAAGIEAGDIIVAVNGDHIEDGSDLRNTIALLREGTDVRIELIRDQDHMTVEARIGSASDQAQTAAASPDAGSVLRGAQVSDIPANHPAYGNVIGVLVTQVEQGSSAWNSGLRAGDIITAVNRRVVASTEALQALLQDNTGAIALNIVREGRNQFLIVR